jgi:hypothetical protein
MAAKMLWMSVLVVGLLALGGLGYSAIMLTDTVTFNAASGQWSAGFTGPVNYENSTQFYPLSSAVICNGPATGNGANALTVTAGNLGPGDWCEVFANLTNTGTIPLEITEIYATGQTFCFIWGVLSPTSTHISIAPGTSEPVQVYVGLQHFPGKGCFNQSETLTIHYHLYAGSGWNGFPGGGP